MLWLCHLYAYYQSKSYGASPLGISVILMKRFILAQPQRFELPNNPRLKQQLYSCYWALRPLCGFFGNAILEQDFALCGLKGVGEPKCLLSYKNRISTDTEETFRPLGWCRIWIPQSGFSLDFNLQLLFEEAFQFLHVRQEMGTSSSNFVTGNSVGQTHLFFQWLAADTPEDITGRKGISRS